jgi:hypothetical protein
VRNLSQKHVAREKEINDFATDYEIPSQLESSVLHNPEVHGGSGFGAATVADLGFDPTLGTTSGEAKPKRRAKKKVIEVGEGLSAAGVSAAGVSGAGVSAAGASGGALLSLRDMDKMHGQPKETIRAKTTAPAKPENAATVAEGAEPARTPARVARHGGHGLRPGSAVAHSGRRVPVRDQGLWCICSTHPGLQL